MCHPPIGGYSLPEKAYRLKVAQVRNVGWWLLASFALWITLSAGWRAVDDMHSSRVFQVLNHSLIRQIQLPVADAWLVTDSKWRTACTLIIIITITTASLSQRPFAFFVQILQRSLWEPDSSFYCLFVILCMIHFFVQSELKVCIGSLHVEAFFSSLHCLICEKWICVTCAWYHIGSKIQPFSFSVFASQQEKMWNVVGRLLKTADNITIHTGALKRYLQIKWE